jgi:hypothetical protein
MHATASWRPILTCLRHLALGPTGPGVTRTHTHRVSRQSGERKHEAKEEDKEGNYTHVERMHGRFMRRLALPDNVDVQNIKAATKDGVLTLTLPKTETEEHNAVEIVVE